MQYYKYPFITKDHPEDEISVDICDANVMLYPFIERNEYLVSNYGNIYKISKNIFIMPTDNNGYNSIRINGKLVLVHRLVAIAFVNGYSNEKNCVNHIDGNKKNNYYKNLEWCTKAENNRHAYATHLNNCVGENCRSAKLTNDQVRYICQLLENNMEIYDILDMIGMERTMNNYEIIRSIRKGYAWKSISKDYNVGYTDYIINSIPTEQVIKICECLSKGLDIRQTHDYVFGPSNIINTIDLPYYSTISSIRRRRSYKEISKDYIFPDTVKTISKRNKDKEELVNKVCKCFENGMSIKETHDFLYGYSDKKAIELENYNFLASIHQRRSFKYISDNYNF